MQMNIIELEFCFALADIVPFYAVGSVSSPICDSVASYGDSELVIGVGSTTLQDSSARTSALGPNVRGALKPDITVCKLYNMTFIFHSTK